MGSAIKIPPGPFSGSSTSIMSSRSRPSASQRRTVFRSWKKAMIPGGIGSQNAITRYVRMAGKTAFAGDAEENEGADHSRVDRPYSTGRQGGRDWRASRGRSPGPARRRAPRRPKAWKAGPRESRCSPPRSRSLRRGRGLPSPGGGRSRSLCACPSARVAGTVAKRRANRPKRPDVCRPMRFSTSSGSQRDQEEDRDHPRPNRAAGITVPRKAGALPRKKRPSVGETPKTISATP